MCAIFALKKPYEKIGTQIKEITEQIPFEIPTNWCVDKIGNISNIYTGNSINIDEKQKNYSNLDIGYNYIATKDISAERQINYNNGVKIPFNTNFKIAPKNTVLLCVEGGSAGKKIALLNEDVCFGNKLACFNMYINISKYLFYYLQSVTFTQIFKEAISGIIGGVSLSLLKNLFIPLPPLAEQHRIIDKIEKLFSII